MSSSFIDFGLCSVILLIQLVAFYYSAEVKLLLIACVLCRMSQNSIKTEKELIIFSILSLFVLLVCI